MRRSKVIQLFVGLIIVMSFFAGCTPENSGKDSTQETENTEVVEEKEIEKTTEIETTEEETIKEGGVVEEVKEEEIKLLSFQDIAGVWKSDQSEPESSMVLYFFEIKENGEITFINDGSTSTYTITEADEKSITMTSDNENASLELNKDGTLSLLLGDGYYFCVKSTKEDAEYEIAEMEAAGTSFVAEEGTAVLEEELDMFFYDFLWSLNDRLVGVTRNVIEDYVTEDGMDSITSYLLDTLGYYNDGESYSTEFGNFHSIENIEENSDGSYTVIVLETYVVHDLDYYDPSLSRAENAEQSGENGGFSRQFENTYTVIRGEYGGLFITDIIVNEIESE